MANDKDQMATRNKRSKIRNQNDREKSKNWANPNDK
jgi:hypothetical protein